MSLILLIAIGLSVLLALNVGANNSGASLATAYGTGARTKKEALILIAIFALLGAVIAGAPVIKTIGGGLVPKEVLSSNIQLIIIVLAIGTVFIGIANILKIPVATTHAIVCAVAGIGLYTNHLNGDKFFEIVKWWVVTPFIAFGINYFIGRFFYFKILRFLTNNFSESKIFKLFGAFLTISGIFVAFSAGANNSANVVAPLVGIGLFTPTVGAGMAGIGMAVGALLLGGRVIETVGKKIADICMIRAVSVELIAGTILFLAAIKGIPVSLAEIITSGIIGFSCAQQGFGSTFRNKHVIRIAVLWFTIPFVTLGISYYLCELYFKSGLF